MTGIFVLLLIFVLSMNYYKVDARGKILVKFQSYQNSRGKGSNGHCCDGRSIFCTSQCDHKFHICVDKFNGDNNFNHCFYGQKTSTKISNRNTISFGSSIANLPNPIELSFDRWQAPGVKVKVRVDDVDSIGSDDHVDDLRRPIALTLARNQDEARWQALTISHRTTLRLEIKAYCDENFYGEGCSRHCVPTDNQHGHYFCDRNTGHKICRPGWTGPSCKQNINECHSNPCLHRGGCLDHVNSYSCHCISGFTGGRCELDIDECASSPCVNGGCINQVNSYACLCELGYTGNNCEVEIDHCAEDPCANNGTCVNSKFGYSCNCSSRFTGKTCNVTVDFCENVNCSDGRICLATDNGYNCVSPCELSNPCLNNSTCTFNGSTIGCICSENYTGEFCEDEVQLPACFSDPCNNNGSCLSHNGTDFTCLCPEPYTGQLCEDQMPICNISNPCMSDSTCIDVQTIQRYICLCQVDYMGRNCEVYIPDLLEDACAKVPCFNNGSCVANYHMVPSTASDKNETMPDVTGKNDSHKLDMTSANPYDLNDNITTEVITDVAMTTSDDFDNDMTSVKNDPTTADIIIQMTTVTATTQDEGNLSSVTNDSFTTEASSVSTEISMADMYSFMNEDIVIDTSCACTEQFTGATCETALTVDSDTDDSESDDGNDDDDPFKDAEKDFDEYPSALLFKEKLKDGDIKNIVDTVKKLVSDHLAVDKVYVRVQHEVRQCLTDGKEKIDAFLFDVYVKDQVVPWSKVDAAFDKMSPQSVDQMLQTPLYEGDRCEPIGGTVEYQKVANKSWLSKNWYILVILGISLVAVAGVIGYIVIRRRRVTKTTVINEYPTLVEASQSLENLQHQPGSTGAENGGHFFENKAYVEYQEIANNQ